MDNDTKRKAEDEETTEIFVPPVQIPSGTNAANSEGVLRANDSNASGHIYAAIDYLTTIFGATNPFIKKVDDDIDGDTTNGNGDENQKNEEGGVDEAEVYPSFDPTQLPKGYDLDEEVDINEYEEGTDDGSPYNVISTPEKQNLHRIDEVTNKKHMSQGHKQDPNEKAKPELEKSWTYIKNDDVLIIKDPIINETMDTGDMNAFIEKQIDSEMLMQEPELPAIFGKSSTTRGSTPSLPLPQTPSENVDEDLGDIDSDLFGPYD